MKIYVYLLILLSLLGCNNKNKTDDFFYKINIDKWNNATLIFMKQNCSNSIFEMPENEILINKYIKHRNNLILKLDDNKPLFGKFTKTLVVSEDYHGINHIVTDYTIINNNMSKSVKFYNKIDKVERGHELQKRYDYDTIINQKSKCINQIKFIINSMRIETELHLDDNKNVIYNIKGCYLNEVKIN